MCIISFASQQGDKDGLYLSFEIKKLWSRNIKTQALMRRVFAMTSAFSWQNSIILCLASFHIPRSNLLVTPGVSWLPTFTFQFSIMKKTNFGVLVLKGLVGFHITVPFQLLQHYCLGHRLGLPWYWMVCLGNEQRSFCPFWDCIQVLHFRLLLTMIATPFLLSDSCSQ